MKILKILTVANSGCTSFGQICEVRWPSFLDMSSNTKELVSAVAVDTRALQLKKQLQLIVY